jgi:cytidylate kinase
MSSSSSQALSEHPCIAVSGFPSSGKSTVAKRLGDHLGYEVVSAGSLIRDYAKNSGATLDQISEKLEADRKVDEYVDGEITKLSGSGTYIFDSRMAWHFVRSAIKIHLEVSLDQAAERAILRPVSEEETYSDLEDAKMQLSRRRASEVARYKKFYDVDIEDYQNYDLVVFTDALSAEEVFQIVKSYVDGFLAGGELTSQPPRFFVAPQALFPTQSIREINADYVGKPQQDSPIECLEYERQMFIWDGHHRAANALLKKESFVEVKINRDGLKGASIRDLLEDSVSNSRNYDWEAAFDISLPKLQNFGN